MGKKKKKTPPASTKPTGLTIDREETFVVNNYKNRFVLSWKFGEPDYNDGQEFRYIYSGLDDYITEKLDKPKEDTSKEITLNRSMFYPTTDLKLSEVKMAVCGNRSKYKKKGKKINPSMSEWAEYTYPVLTPHRPTVVSSLSEDYAYTSIFSSVVENSNTETYWFTNAFLETVLVKESNETGESILSGWQGLAVGKDTPTADNYPARLWQTDTEKESHIGTMYFDRDDEDYYEWVYENDTYSWKQMTITPNYPLIRFAVDSVEDSTTIQITEDSTLLADIGDTSYTRHFRAKSIGPAGDSKWAYAKHVYAAPYQAVIKSTNVSSDTPNVIKCYVSWTVETTYSHPIDKVVIQYTMAVPGANMSCPNDASWTDAKSINDTSDDDAASFYIDRALSGNQCLFVRVNTVHDDNIRTGVPTLVMGAGEYLIPPTVTAISTDDETYKVSVSATNNASEVVDSDLAIVYRVEGQSDLIIGKLTKATDTFQCPAWTDSSKISIGVYAVVADWVPNDHYDYGTTDPVTVYSIGTPKLISTTNWDDGDVPKAPTAVYLSRSDILGTVIVEWDWPWKGANVAELSWSDHEDAWESTDEPNSYKIENIHAAKWNISGLETGVKWYIRVRLIQSSDSGEVLGPWSTAKNLYLSSVPVIPTLDVTKSVITENEKVTASWSYNSTDGTDQASADICLVTIGTNGTRTYGEIIASTATEQSTVLDPAALGWENGQTYYIAARVTSSSLEQSGWSAEKSITIAEPLEATIVSTSLISDGTRNYLKSMPLEIEVSGAGSDNITNIYISRAKAYRLDRPDESVFNGYEGEIVYFHSQIGENPIVIENNDSELLGALDDGADYELLAVVSDSLGQVAQASLEFKIDWTHQAVMLDSEDITVESDNELLITTITVSQPDGFSEGDTIDIYRLSSDKPQLIIQNGGFNTTYVDPFPAFGEFGGHRVVYKTINGDYITSDNKIASTDLDSEDGDIIETPYSVIDFENNQARIMYNLDLSNNWSKGFEKTEYMGGSIQGDWTAGVTKDSTINIVVPIEEDPDVIDSLRALGEYPGKCHVRTRDGSSYAADVQVSETMNHDSFLISSYSLKITRIDNQRLDGMTLEDWDDIHDEEEEEE